jgi:hypothetical protein
MNASMLVLTFCTSPDSLFVGLCLDFHSTCPSDTINQEMVLDVIILRY